MEVPWQYGWTLVRKGITFSICKTQKHTNVDGQLGAKVQEGRWTYNPAVNRQPGFRRTRLAEQLWYTAEEVQRPSRPFAPSWPSTFVCFLGFAN